MDKEKVLAMLAQEWALTPIKDNELTSRDIAEALKAVGSMHSREYVSRKIKRLIDDEMLSKRSVAVNGGGKQIAYSPAEGKSWEDVLQYIKVS